MMLLNMELERDVHNGLQYIMGYDTENVYLSDAPKADNMET